MTAQVLLEQINPLDGHTEDDLLVFDQDRRGETFDSGVLNDAELSHLDPDAIADYRSIRAEINPVAEELRWTDNELLEALGCLRDEHFAKATHNQNHSGAEIGEIEGKAIIRPLRENEKGPEFPGLSRPFSSVSFMAVPPTGAELSQDSAGKSRFDDQGDAESDAFSDARLVKLIEVWPALSDALKAEILRLVGYDVDDLNDVTAITVSAGNGVS